MHLKDEVTDFQYELALMIYKIAESKIARWLQTRETPELNFRNILNRDIYTYSCGEVKPGGYKVNKGRVDSCRGGQFGVNELEKRAFELKLKELGFSVDYSWVRP